MDNNAFGEKVIEKALRYANYEWYATAKNIFHGIDENGIEVNTPDITWKGEILDCGWWQENVKNIGIPYGWGNASTIEEFIIGISKGKYAGNVPDDKTGKRASCNTVGVDCSGLLTICWGLPKKISTHIIPEYADEIELDQIRQGDVFAKLGSHVMIFKEFISDVNNDRAIIIDATRSTGKVSERIVRINSILEDGYKVYRKK